METVTLIDDEFITMVYDAEHNMIRHQYHQAVGGEQFRHILSTGVKAMEKYGADKWLSDDRKNAVISDEDTEWATNIWSKESIALGWKYWALVVPDDLYARMNLTEHVNAYAKKGVVVKVFVDPETAMSWIDSL